MARLAQGALAALALALALAMVARAEDDCPVNCDCDRTGVGILVNCSARNLTAFPTIPANIAELMLELDVSHNAIRRLPSSTPTLPHLRALSLADNQLSALPWRWLRRVPSVRRLDLAGNTAFTLLGLGERGLTHAPGLQLLNLSRCAAVDDLAGAELVLVSDSLEILDLSHCSLPEATGLLTDGFPSLRLLDLSYNPLHLLQGLNSTTLQVLYLLRTGLDSIHPAALLDLPSLVELDVSGNRGFAFPERGTLSFSLTVLHARFCELRLHNLKAFPNLRYANLRGNGIQRVWNTSFANEHLIELDLSNNNIHRIHPDAFGHLPSLQTLILTNNKITSLPPEVFDNNPFLTQVNLSSNTLTDLGRIKAEALKLLDISKCNVDKLTADSLEGMPALRILDLSSNRLERVPDNLTSETLQWLDLSFCRLTTIGNDTFRRLPMLLMLNLSGNRLTEPLRRQAFASNKRLRMLRLSDNPWRCDCASQDFLEFVEFTMSIDQTEAMVRARCGSPEALQGRSWLQACYDEWYPSLDEREPVRRFGVAMLAVAAVAGGALVLLSALRQAVQKRRKEAQRRRQEEMERRLEERERELREQIRQELDDDDDIFRGPRSRPHRTPSEITQPPTYEEALLLSRSQQDLLNERTAAAAAAAAEEDAAATDSATHTPATYARHLIYEVEAEHAPKPRPVKPPRKTGKWASGDRLHSSQASLGAAGSSAGAGRSAARHSAPSAAAGLPEEMLSAIAEAMADAGAVASAAAAPAARASAPATTPASVARAAAAAGSLESSAASTPARTPRLPQRPRSGCSSDASGEDSDESRQPSRPAPAPPPPAPPPRTPPPVYR